MSETPTWFVGIDWGGSVHDVCVVDAAGVLRGTRRVNQTAAAVHEALQWVTAITGAPPAGIAIGIERPHGLLVDTLVDAGFQVWAINPKQLDRFRDRFTAAGAKDDRRDAHALADGVRTDRRAFRRVQPDDPRLVQLRELTRMRDDLLEDERRVTNRLYEQLMRVDAPWLTFCPAADEPWLWALLAAAPDPAEWPQLAKRRIAPILRAHRIRRITAEAIVTALRAPRLVPAAGVTDAVAARLATLGPQLELLHRQRLDAEHQIDRLLTRLAPEAPETELREHRDVEILRSLPGVGRIVAATMLTEATGPMAARDYGTLRAYAGAAPVSKRSGKRLWVVHMRYACRPRLRNALYHWARVSVQRDAAARAYYDELRARNHGHARALRSVADRWLRILVAMLKSRSLYDPTRTRRANAVAA